MAKKGVKMRGLEKSAGKSKIQHAVEKIKNIEEFVLTA